MKTTSKVRKKKAVPEPRMSHVQKPPRYTLEGWQLALRHQQAVKEPLSVEEAGEENAHGLHLVRNPISRNRYEVRYYGAGHPLNRCSCMDFRTSRLGSCKHMEAVRLWIAASRGRKVHAPDGRETWLYVDYSRAPALRMAYGTEDVFQAALDHIVVSHGLDYERLWASFKRTNRWILQALSTGRPLQSGEHRTSTVYSALKRLQKDGYVIYSDRYEIEDPFFKQWILAHS